MKLTIMMILVAKVAFSTPEPSIEAVKAKFDEAAVEWHAIDQVNWPAFPYHPLVEFRIMHSETEIYLQYHVREQGARATFDYDAGSAPYTDDCVEFFMIPSDRDPSYFNLEMNCIGHGTFDYGHSLGQRHCCGDAVISQIRRESTLGSKAFGTLEGEQDWTITIAIPKRLYAQVDLDLTQFSGRTVRANFYKCGDKTAVPHFLSWNPVNTPKPAFHVPECFGEIRFE